MSKDFNTSKILHLWKGIPNKEFKHIQYANPHYNFNRSLDSKSGYEQFNRYAHSGLYSSKCDKRYYARVNKKSKKKESCDIDVRVYNARQSGFTDIEVTLPMNIPTKVNFIHLACPTCLQHNTGASNQNNFVNKLVEYCRYTNIYTWLALILSTCSFITSAFIAVTRQQEKYKIKVGLVCISCLIFSGLCIICSLVIYISTDPNISESHSYGSAFYSTIIVFFLTQIEVVIATNATVFKPTSIPIKKRRPSILMNNESGQAEKVGMIGNNWTNVLQRVRSTSSNPMVRYRQSFKSNEKARARFTDLVQQVQNAKCGSTGDFDRTVNKDKQDKVNEKANVENSLLGSSPCPNIETAQDKTGKRTWKKPTSKSVTDDDMLFNACSRKRNSIIINDLPNVKKKRELDKSKKTTEIQVQQNKKIATSRTLPVKSTSEQETQVSEILTDVDDLTKPRPKGILLSRKKKYSQTFCVSIAGRPILASKDLDSSFYKDPILRIRSSENRSDTLGSGKSTFSEYDKDTLGGLASLPRQYVPISKKNNGAAPLHNFANHYSATYARKDSLAQMTSISSNGRSNWTKSHTCNTSEITTGQTNSIGKRPSIIPNISVLDCDGQISDRDQWCRNDMIKAQSTKSRLGMGGIDEDSLASLLAIYHRHIDSDFEMVSTKL